VDLELIEKLLMAFEIQRFVDVVVPRFLMKLDKVEDVDAYGLMQFPVGLGLFQLFAIESAPVVERAFGKPVFLEHLHFDIVPGALFALGLDIQHASLIFEILFFVVWQSVPRMILLRWHGLFLFSGKEVALLFV
jgi:hypothetical protein